MICVISNSNTGATTSFCSLYNHSIVASTANTECMNADLVFAEGSLSNDLVRVVDAAICQKEDTLLNNIVRQINFTLIKLAAVSYLL